MSAATPAPGSLAGRLAGRRILVTGAASGIGRAIALRAQAEGAQVALADRDADALQELSPSSPGGAPTMVLVGDLGDRSVPSAWVAQMCERFGGIDGMVCAAGITRTSAALDYSLEDWDEVLAVNLTGAFLCAREAARAMVEAGTGGSIITISSALALTGQHSGVAYVASKAGLIGATKTMALEFGPQGVRCNSIAPGLIETPLIRRTLTDEYIAAWGGRTALGRVGEPEDLAPTACFLLAEESHWITGQTFHVNGGFIMP